MTHDKFCDLILAPCDSRDFRHQAALQKRWGCLRCNRWCDCDKIRKIRADEKAGEHPCEHNFETVTNALAVPLFKVCTKCGHKESEQQ